MNADGFKPKNEYGVYQAIDGVFRWLYRRLPLNATTEHLALKWGFKFSGKRTTVRLFDGQFMSVDPTDYLQCLIYYFGIFEPHCIQFLPTLLQPNDTFIDIGGNIGLYTIVASKIVGKNGKVLTFEPAPFHCEAIRKNIELNRIENVALYETALGSEDGSVQLVLPEGGNRGMFALAKNGEADDLHNAPVPVKLSRFSSLVKAEAIERVSLIKLDIEGAEPLALSGMDDLFNRFCPSVLIELNEASLQRLGNHSAHLVQWFTQRGYKGWVIRPNGILEPLSLEGQSNATSLCYECLFVHSANASHLNRIDAKVRS
ncbi:MAG: FkbM family methyltransferase [Thermosynechococcaceae cyanobacterium]